MTDKQSVGLSRWQFVTKSLRYFLPSHAPVALGVAAATAVIVGALVVGDSVRGSLRALVLDRLANLECFLHSTTYFEPSTLAELPQDREFAVVPTIVMSSISAEAVQGEALHRASQVQLIGVDAELLQHLDETNRKLFPQEVAADQVVLNESLASDLSVKVGDEITLRLTEKSGVPADNTLGRRDETSLSLPRQKVVGIVPDASFGGVRFAVGQTVARNVFANLQTLRDILEVGSKVNAAFVMQLVPELTADRSGQLLCDDLNLALVPKIEDYGLSFSHRKRVFPDTEIGEESIDSEEPKEIFDYYQLSADSLLLDNATSNAVMGELGSDRATRLITYLLNSLNKVEPTRGELSRSRSVLAEEQRPRGRFVPQALSFIEPEMFQKPEVEEPLSRVVPYSIIVGVDRNSELDLNTYTTVAREDLRFPYCWINSWLAEQIDAKGGDWIDVKFYEPETVDGREIEKSEHFMIAGIVPIEEPKTGYRRDRVAVYSKQPTIFNDPGLTPSVPGVTDQDSIANWDLPFELKAEELIEPVDDEYWKNHRLTPKVFMPYQYASSETRFGSRFGQTTAIRIPASKLTDEAGLRKQIETALLPTRTSHGLYFQPLRSTQLKAAAGTTPFDMLFLSLSFFVIVAALLLVTLLFKLGIRKRTSQLGVLMSQGFSSGKVRGILLSELSIVTLIGSALGIALGLAYARLMVAGLETWWLGAITVPFLKFLYSGQSLVVGAVAGVSASLASIFLSLRGLRSASPLSLLRGEDADMVGKSNNLQKAWVAGVVFTGIAAAVLAAFGIGQAGMARAGSFFGCGMLLLASIVMLVRSLLEFRAYGSHQESRGSIWQLAWRAIGRNPMRSTLSLGLLAVASFLIASMGVFQVAPNERGYGGFDLIAESSQPVFRNIATASVRTEVIGNDAKALAGSTIVPMRELRGEDASCNNLFQVSQPTVLGVPRALRAYYELSASAVGFSWAATQNPDDPWSALDSTATGEADSPIPVILDQNTAAWSLKQGASLDATIKVEYSNRIVYFRTVGLLFNSVLQGKLLIGENNFKSLFPDISGASFFLISSGQSANQSDVAAALEKGWSDVGMDVTPSREILQQLLGVQNTYISAFQSLGALGLLLGALGLIATQVRSVVERRSELALMQALGFSESKIARMLTLETLLLLGGGLAVGVVCAAIALVPYVVEVGPELSVFTPVLMLMGVMLVGYLAAGIAVRAATRQNILESLRAE